MALDGPSATATSLVITALSQSRCNNLTSDKENTHSGHIILVRYNEHSGRWVIVYHHDITVKNTKTQAQVTTKYSSSLHSKYCRNKICNRNNNIKDTTFTFI